MPEFEAIGDAATGALLGRAVEPKAGESDGHTHETHCLNCGCELTGQYCHCCGQHSHVHRTLSAFFHDMAHGVLHFEGKVWNTLPLLAWKPGEITRRYIDGERAKFVSPIALFLFSVFLLFAIASLTGSFDPADTEAMRRDLSEEIARQDTAVADLEKVRETVRLRGGPTAAIDARIDEARKEAAGMRSGVIATGQAPNIDAPGWIRGPIERAARNPDLLLYKLRTNAYKFSWALIPLSVPFLWLLFPFSRRFRLYDHTVFVTYSLSFMTLLAVAAMLLGLAGLPAAAGLAVLIPPFHMYRQLKGTYGLSRVAALVRTLRLIVLASVALGLFGLILVGLGLFD